MSTQPATPAQISILLTCYNFRAYLREAVDSLLAQQTARSFEIIVIDDASPDRSFEVLADIDDPRLQLIVHDTNQGFARSISEGFERSRGSYFCRWDGDDRWPPVALEQLASALDSCPDSVVAFAQVNLLSADGKSTSARIDRPAGPAERDEFLPLFLNHYSCAPAMMGRRDAWQKVMPWRDGHIDWFYNLKLAQLGKFVFIDQHLPYYRTHAQGAHVLGLHDGKMERHFERVLNEFSRFVSPSALRASLAQNYRHFALSYFGLNREEDARRCFKLVLRNSPSALLNRQCLGPLIACFLLGTQRYNALKRWLRRN